jgi:mono/diheme cytochrome c family protein
VRLALCLALLAGCGKSVPEATLSFARDGKPIGALTTGQLRDKAERITAVDPYYKKQKRWLAVPIGEVLARGFGKLPAAGDELLMRAKDGYTVPVAAARLAESGAYLAIADLDLPAWEPIGPQRSDPAPFYLVWTGATQQDLEAYPRPWALASIEIARVETVFPHVVPSGEAADSPVMKGFTLFRGACLRCHAINREGGRVGPDLNVPKSIVEYRPEDQIRAYIRDPLTFRYGAMPAHPQLSDADLDALIAYFHAMKSRKHDPK